MLSLRPFCEKTFFEKNPVITFGSMQFTAVILMILLTVKLLTRHNRRAEGKLANRSRWFMTAGTATLAVHFTLQMKLGLRLMGVTQSVVLNLALLIPASYYFAIAVLILQRRGRLSLWDWLLAPVVWLVCVGNMVAAVMADDMPLFSDSPLLRKAEQVDAIIYMLMQTYYTIRLIMSLRAMHRALNDFYDRDINGMLYWMQLSIIGLTLLALMVPVAIFGSGPWVLLIAFAIYFFIFYLVDSFCAYLNSNAPAHMKRAEQNAEEMEREYAAEQQADKNAICMDTEDGCNYLVLDDETMREIDEAVARWTARGGHLRNGLQQPLAAADIGVAKYRLTCWLHQRGLKYTEWMSELRVVEAKRIIKEHPDWSTEAIAQHCGFTERTLQRAFKKYTGMSPVQYAGQQAV